jgi:Icc-related predicted phosphoesterase
MRVAWVTDIHLNFLSPEAIRAFCRRIASEEPDYLLVGGDIGEADSVESGLVTMEHELACPIRFVLGNHDFYRGSIPAVRAAMAALSRRSFRLGYLSCVGVVGLTERTGLIGHDGWADGRLGDYANSPVMLNDYVFIQELAWLDRQTRLERLNALGDEAAAHVRRVLPEALARFETVLLLTHVPPFGEACWHEGRISDADWLPHFTCGAVGDALRSLMQARPDRELRVLCGHTHGAGRVRILPNLEAITGGARYGSPELQGILEVD